MKVLVTILISLFFFSSEVQAQEVEEEKYVTIKLINGKRVAGILSSETDEYFLVQTDIGEIKIQRSEVKEIMTAKTPKLLAKKTYRDFSDSYFLLPSARPVGVGNSHYKNYNIFFNQFNFGVSENFSLGAGFESASIFIEGEAPRVFYFAPKFSFGGDKSYFGLGTSLFIVREGGVGGLAFLNYTYGSDDQHLTVGASYAYSSDGGSEPLIFNISFIQPVAKNVGIVGEAVFGDFEGVLFDFGLRIKTRSGISFDAAIIRTSGQVGGVGIPLLGISVPFN